MFNASAASARSRRNVCLVDNDKVRSVTEKCITMRSALGLHRINAGDEVGVVAINGYVLACPLAFKPSDLRWLDKNAFDCELFAQLTFPLIAEMRRREYG